MNHQGPISEKVERITSLLPVLEGEYDNYPKECVILSTWLI